MDYLKPIYALLRDWLPVLITVLVGILVVWGAYRILMKRQPPSSGSRISQQLLIAALAGVFLIIVILELPIADAPRGQLLSLLGILGHGCDRPVIHHSARQRHGGTDVAVDPKLQSR